MRRHVLVVLLVAAGGAACGDDSSTTLPTSPTTTLSALTEIFTGSLAVSGTSFHTFTMNQAGTASVTLASLQSSGAPVSTNVSVGLGTPDVMPSPTACTVTSTATNPLTIAPALTTQVSVSLESGDRCVAIQDVGNLTGPLAYAIRVTHP